MHAYILTLNSLAEMKRSQNNHCLVPPPPEDIVLNTQMFQTQGIHSQANTIQLDQGSLTGNVDKKLTANCSFNLIALCEMRKHVVCSHWKCCGSQWHFQ